MVVKLPIPKKDALDHSQQLLEYILFQLRAQHGSLSFASYMALALYTPGLGYYSCGTQKLGAGGDFITAPELSPLFSKSLARQCQQILQTLAGGDIVEIGAGSGKMAAHILLELEKNHSLPAQYYILELSADLKKRQKDTIFSLCPQLLSRVIWLNTLPEKKINGIILANEVLDAMPVHQFKILNHRAYNIHVIEEQHALKYACPHVSDNERTEIELADCLSFSDGYTSEINLNLKPWIFSLSDCLQKGVILLIDYGFPRTEYYHPDRRMGTVMCHYRHYAHSDPFWYPGLQDITAHVDFTAIAEAATEVEMDVLGYCEQAAFLFSCGLADCAEQTMITTQKEKILQNQAIQVLTSPAEMGELFKVIALGRNFDEPLIGFSLIDRRYAL